jgi:phosphatidylserine/phosphatidylglycerophosphate/cardiolipin synthase-like enzyme
MAANHLYSQLSEHEKPFLKVFFYVAADQDHPIHNAFKQRSCHIKLLIADDSVAVQGSGNQDTQSWFHSQEVNILVDSPVVCRAWREGIERNQNTALFGRANEDGCFYDKDGNLAPGSYGIDAGNFAWAKGFFGILNKAQGK